MSDQDAPRPGPVVNLAELAGYGLVVGFLWFVWPPLVLLGAGLLLIIWANTRRPSASRGRTAGAIAAAAAAARTAWRSASADELARRRSA